MKKRGLGAGDGGVREGRKILSSSVPSPEPPAPSLKRYARVAGAAAKVGVGVASNRLFGGGEGREAALFRGVLGGLKGPLMKVAQLLATIPDFLPPAYAAELASLQSEAPAMGWPFVRRRMAAELGPDWQSRFRSFEREAASAASFGQVHRAVTLGGDTIACKLQYPSMESVVEADLKQLKIAMDLFERFGGAVRAGAAYDEIAERLREELDYQREAANMQMFASIFANEPYAHVPQVQGELSTAKLLCMSWLEGEKFLEAAASRSQAARNHIAANMFRVWYGPFYRYGVLHGDPHLGNYTIVKDGSINLFDFGCVRVFEPSLVQAVIMMYEALRDDDRAKIDEAFRLWGFDALSKETTAILTDWARFIYAPLLDDRARPIAETNSTAAGRKLAGEVYRSLQASGGVSLPRAFVLIDRASIGLGSVFLHLQAEVNWHRLFNEMIENFDLSSIKEKQQNMLLKSRFPIEVDP